MRYLSPLTVARLRRLRKRSMRFRSPHGLAGPHRSRLAGLGQEFSQHRQYNDGDDIRFVDWKAFARRDRLYIKEFEEEKSLRVWILLDASASMGFRGSAAPLSKWEHSCRIAMGLAYLLSLQGDYCGLCAFSEGIRVRTEPAATLSALSAIDEALASLSPSGRASLPDALPLAMSGCERAGAFILLSDLLDESENFAAAAASIKRRGSGAALFHVADREEIELPYSGRTLFSELEGGSPFECEPETLRGEYASLMKERLHLCQSACHAASVAYFPTFTDLPPESALENAVGVLSGRLA